MATNRRSTRIPETTTRAGTAVRIYSMAAGEDRPIVGAWQNGDQWVPHSWAAEGFHHGPDTQCSLDLVWPIKE